ncbi:unnamed protein product [Allacma fusca]|uniref:Uncharacterized protein n=1 Tax=Allacma fusca TaxID=39272 RepID=A0A8J2LE93_9HEXA|nr:unnamed protein product [Allacma fusca]
MSQGFVLCILDYDFMIMDNAFLVHRPGIKKKKRNKKPTLAIRRQNRLLTTLYQTSVVHTCKFKSCNFTLPRTPKISKDRLIIRLGISHDSPLMSHWKQMILNTNILIHLRPEF